MWKLCGCSESPKARALWRGGRCQALAKLILSSPQATAESQYRCVFFGIVVFVAIVCSPQSEITATSIHLLDPLRLRKEEDESRWKQKDIEHSSHRLSGSLGSVVTILVLVAAVDLQ
jgi:hypothetical protein